MQTIDQAHFSFSPAIGIAMAFMVGFLVFAVALDLKWEQFRRVRRNPRGPAIGLIAQFLVLPAVAATVGSLLVEVPSVAVGLLLVACCPGGALSNFFTGIARGDVATSVSMTALSTVVGVVATPLVFSFWASSNPAIASVLEQIDIDARKAIVMLLVMIIVPVTAGMLVRARRPDYANRLRGIVRVLSGLVFASVVAVVLGQNLGLLLRHAHDALLPVLLTFTIAALLGYALARAARLLPAERRAVTIEVAMQNVGLAIGTAVAVFPSLVGVAVTAALWGVVHLTFGFALAAAWRLAPVRPEV